MVCKIRKKWIDIEMEHTENRAEATKIAKDHLKEFGCAYYPELIKMEKKLSRKWLKCHVKNTNQRNKEIYALLPKNGVIGARLKRSNA